MDYYSQKHQHTVPTMQHFKVVTDPLIVNNPFEIMVLNSVCNYNLAIEKFSSIGIPGKLLFLGILLAHEMKKAEVILLLN